MQAIERSSHTQLHGVYSTDSERAQARLQAMGLGARVYEDFAELAKEPEVNAIVLCSTPDIRPEQVAIAASHGKHLVIEKPLAMNRAALQQMAEALRQYPVCTVASFVLRWNPSFDTTKALIDSGALGSIFMAQIDYWHDIGPKYGQYRWSSTKQLGGSSILSAGCHAVDALRYFAGEIEEVVAYSCTTRQDSGYEFDPNTLAICKLRNGGIGKVSSSIECKTTYKFNVHLLGDKGSIMNNQLFSHTLPGQTDYATIPTVLPDSGDVSHHPFFHEIEELALAIRQGSSIRCDFWDAYKTMEACFAIDESIATGHKVALA